MEIEKRPLITNSLLKYIYVGLSVGGTVTLACNAYLDMQQIAQDKHHNDPESEAAAAFVAASAFGYCLSKLVYHFWFIPTKQQTTNGTHKQPKIKNRKAINNEKWKKAVKTANRKRDRSARKNGKIKGF